jgi:hypothetical protein
MKLATRDVHQDFVLVARTGAQAGEARSQRFIHGTERDEREALVLGGVVQHWPCGPHCLLRVHAFLGFLQCGFAAWQQSARHAGRGLSACRRRPEGRHAFCLIWRHRSHPGEVPTVSSGRGLRHVEPEWCSGPRTPWLRNRGKRLRLITYCWIWFWAHTSSDSLWVAKLVPGGCRAPVTTWNTEQFP